MILKNVKAKKKHKTVEVIELKGKGKIFNCKNVSEDILRKQKQKKKRERDRRRRKT